MLVFSLSPFPASPYLPRLWLTKKKILSNIRKILGLFHVYPLGRLVLSWEKPWVLGFWGNRVG